MHRQHSTSGAFDCRGKGGLELNEKYESGIRTLLGIHSHGYPNLFIMGGYQASFRFNLTDLERESLLLPTLKSAARSGDETRYNAVLEALGDRFPIASNLNEFGRERNRRVNIVIARDNQVPRLMNPAIKKENQLLMLEQYLHVDNETKEESP